MLSRSTFVGLQVLIQTGTNKLLLDGPNTYDTLAIGYFTLFDDTFSGNYDLILSYIIPVMLLQSIHLILI